MCVRGGRQGEERTGKHEIGDVGLGAANEGTRLIGGRERERARERATERRVRSFR